MVKSATKFLGILVLAAFSQIKLQHSKIFIGSFGYKTAATAPSYVGFIMANSTTCVAVQTAL